MPKSAHLNQFLIVLFDFAPVSKHFLSIEINVTRMLKEVSQLQTSKNPTTSQ